MKLILLSALASLSVSLSAHALTNSIKCTGGSVSVNLSSNERLSPSKIPSSVSAYMNSLKKNPRIAHVSLANKIIISHTVAKEGQAIYSVQAVGGFPDMVVCGWVNNSDIKKEMLAVQENQRKALEQARQYRINREETLRIEREARELAEQRREQEAKEEETKKVAVSLNEGEQI